MKQLKLMLISIAIICIGNFLILLNVIGNISVLAAVGMVLSAIGIITFVLSLFCKNK